MDNDRQRQLTRFIALALVTGGHVLLLLLLFNSKPIDVRTQAQAPGTLILLESPRPQQAQVARGLSLLPSASVRSIEQSLPDLPPIRDDLFESSIEVPVSPETDWQLEAQRSVEAMAPGWLEEQKRKCETADGPPPPECRQRKYEFGWSSETGKVGLSGLLPYVRLGQRCVIGLGFFGCGIGKLPEPNGDLFEHMRDPDRPRSSVPDVPEPGM
jgi:hypothetical protein